MWYFTWILGVSFACGFGVLNALWFELDADRKASKPAADSTEMM